MDVRVSVAPVGIAFRQGSGKDSISIHRYRFVLMQSDKRLTFFNSLIIHSLTPSIAEWIVGICNVSSISSFSLHFGRC